jgi:hypothetical protein
MTSQGNNPLRMQAEIRLDIPGTLIIGRHISTNNSRNVLQVRAQMGYQ